MGMSDSGDLPDTYGLQEFFVTEVAMEIDGPNVRMVRGVRRGGQVHWLFCEVVPAEKLFIFAKRCERIAEQAFNAVQMLGEYHH